VWGRETTTHFEMICVSLRLINSLVTVMNEMHQRTGNGLNRCMVLNGCCDLCDSSSNNGWRVEVRHGDTVIW